MDNRTINVPITKDYDLEVKLEAAPIKTGVGRFVFYILNLPITVITSEDTTVESVNLKKR